MKLLKQASYKSLALEKLHNSPAAWGTPCNTVTLRLSSKATSSGDGNHSPSSSICTGSFLFLGILLTSCPFSLSIHATTFCISKASCTLAVNLKNCNTFLAWLTCCAKVIMLVALLTLKLMYLANSPARVYACNVGWATFMKKWRKPKYRKMELQTFVQVLCATEAPSLSSWMLLVHQDLSDVICEASGSRSLFALGRL